MTAAPPARLAPALSLYLDCLRLAASLAVFAGHAKVMLFETWRLGPLFGQSREAVAVFFVLSGFTIRFVSVDKERDWRDYAVARVSRLYSVVLIAIPLTWALDASGSLLNPQYYTMLSFFQPETFTAALRYLSFTNEVWTSHAVFGTDEPYWSLGFEAPYYLVFGVALFTRGIWRVLLVCGWFAACGPKIAAYLPLWLIGVAAYEVQARWQPRWTKHRLLGGIAGTVAAYVAIWTLLGKTTGNIYDHDSWSVTSRTLLYFHLVGLLVGANIVLFASLTPLSRGLGPNAARTIRWLAGASFTLYLLHQPVLVFLSSVMPSEIMSPGSARLGCCVVTLALILAFAELGERRKRWFSRGVRRFVGRQAAHTTAI